MSPPTSGKAAPSRAAKKTAGKKKAAKKTAGKRTTQRPAKPAPAERPSAQAKAPGADVAKAKSHQEATVDSDAFRAQVTEMYGLPETAFWSKWDKHSSRFSHIIRHVALQTIARMDGLVFSRPIVHEQPGRVVTYENGLGPDQLAAIDALRAGAIGPPNTIAGPINSVRDFPLTPHGKLANGNRWSLEGFAWQVDNKGEVVPGSLVRAFASGSDAGPDVVDYGSPFLGAQNRLHDRLVTEHLRRKLNAGAFDIYSETEASDFAFPTDRSEGVAVKVEGSSTWVASKGSTEIKAESIRTNDEDLKPADGKVTFAAPELASEPRTEAEEADEEEPEVAEEGAEAANTCSPDEDDEDDAKEAEEEPEEEVEEAPAKDDSVSPDGIPKDSTGWAPPPKHKTQLRLSKHDKKKAPSILKAYVAEAKKTDNKLHLVHLAKHMLWRIEIKELPLSDEQVQELKDCIDKRKGELGDQPFNVTKSSTSKKAEPSAQKSADEICAAIMKCKTDAQLKKFWLSKLTAVRALPEALKEQCEKAKNQRKARLSEEGS